MGPKVTVSRPRTPRLAEPLQGSPRSLSGSAGQILFRWTVLQQDSGGAERWRMLRRWMTEAEARSWAEARQKTIRRVDAEV